MHSLKAYAGADVEICDEGLLMRYSPPAEVRKTLVQGARLKLVESGAGRAKPRTRNRIAPPVHQPELDL